MHAAGVIRRSLVTNKDKTYNIKNIDPGVAKGVKPYFFDYIQRNYTTESSKNNKWMTCLAKLEELFNTSI